MTNDDLIAYVSVKKSKWIYVHHMRNKIHLISNAEEQDNMSSFSHGAQISARLSP